MFSSGDSSKDLDAVFQENLERTIGPLERLLSELRPSIEDLFLVHNVPPVVAERLLRETLQTLAWKWESVRNRNAWMLAILERKCVTSREESDRQPWDGLG